MKSNKTLTSIGFLGSLVFSASMLFAQNASALSCIMVVVPPEEIAEKMLDILHDADRITEVSDVNNYASAPGGYSDMVTGRVVFSYKLANTDQSMDVAKGPWGTPILTIAGNEYIVENMNNTMEQVEFGVCSTTIFPEKFQELATDYIDSLERFETSRRQVLTAVEHTPTLIEVEKPRRSIPDPRPEEAIQGNEIPTVFVGEAAVVPVKDIQAQEQEVLGLLMRLLKLLGLV
jgi:hypothetical protein